MQLDENVKEILKVVGGGCKGGGVVCHYKKTRAIIYVGIYLTACIILICWYVCAHMCVCWEYCPFCVPRYVHSTYSSIVV